MLNSDERNDDPESGSRRMRKPWETAGPRKTKRWVIIGALIAFVFWSLAAIFFFFRGAWRTHSHDPIAHERRLSFDESRSYVWYPHTARVDWTNAHGQDGMYLVCKAGQIKLAHVNGSETLFLDESNVVPDQLKDSGKISIEQYWISPDMQYVLIATKIRSNWRHSFFARYWVHDIKTSATVSLVPDDVNAEIAYATWSPTKHSIAYVLGGNLWVRDMLGIPVQVTFDGSKNIINGIPDWVYEEEVFQKNNALWWAPDSRGIAFLKTDDTPVEEYPLEFFITPTPPDPEIYPEVEELKYPKPGTSNPIVSIQFYDLDTKAAPKLLDMTEQFQNGTRLITEVKWLGPERLFLRETNRDSTVQQTFILEPRTAVARLSEQLNMSEIDDGWFEVSRNTHFVPASPRHGREHDGFIDLVISEGNRHLALYSPPDTKTPRMLTSGDWEVVDGTQAIDLERNLAYFLSTKYSGIDRHLYSVDLTSGELNALTDDTQPGYFAVDFSPQSGYYVLQYAGPNVPWQKIRAVDDASFEIILEENGQLQDNLAKYDLPQKVYSTITIDGLEMNTVELRPPNFDGSGKTKYPVLFNPYGGPASQSVNRKFSVDWHSWLASDPMMDYIVVTVDGRGTGYMGRKLRQPIRGNIGQWEANDQIEAAKLWKQRPYTDPDRFAIWGWSFGGYLTLKVLEAGSGIFQYGMAVAPVTDWRFYDSIYTERFMGTIEDNKAGYEATAITNALSFSRAKRFLIMHGTGDDNVHFQNTLSFVDKLNMEGVENYDMHIFPDSDHGIFFHSANRQVYHRLSNFLRQAFGLRDPLAEDRSWQGAGWPDRDY